MRIGHKITLSFAVILAIAIAIGLIALATMHEASGKSHDLANKQVPAVALAHEIERSSLETMYHIRGYTMSDDESLLHLGEKTLKSLQDHAVEARSFAIGNALPRLQKDAEEATKEAKHYAELLEKTRAAMDRTHASIAASNRASDTIAAEIMLLLQDQEEKVTRDIEAGANHAQIAESCLKLKISNNIINICNEIRIADLVRANPGRFSWCSAPGAPCAAFSARCSAGRLGNWSWSIARAPESSRRR